MAAARGSTVVFDDQEGFVGVILPQNTTTSELLCPKFNHRSPQDKLQCRLVWKWFVNMGWVGCMLMTLEITDVVSDFLFIIEVHEKYTMVNLLEINVFCLRNCPKNNEVTI